METEEILKKANEFDRDGEWRKKVENALRRYEKFISLYPFRKHPEKIDLLTPEKLYNPGAGEYFFNWIEHKLKDLGYIRIGSALIWENARDNIELFKELLKKVTNDSRPISDKIDTNWEDIKFFAGDIYTLSRILGHSTVKVTERYAHLSPHYGRDTIELMGRHMGKTNDTLMTLGQKKTAQETSEESKEIEKLII